MTPSTTALEEQIVVTRAGVTVEVLVGGPLDGRAVVCLHGFVGHVAGEPFVEELARSGLRVYAPLWPGYGRNGTEAHLRTMLDFALHGADIVDALRLGPGHGKVPPHVVGHSMGGMIAAEMTALAPYGYGGLVLISPYGLWLDQHPVVDIFALLPYEFPRLLFRHEQTGKDLMAGDGRDFGDSESIKSFLIQNSRRLGTAGKILFPIPDRGLVNRLYRISNPTLLVWGDSDALLGPPYEEAWSAALPQARRVTVPDAGHMSPYEQPTLVAAATADFFSAL